MQPHQSATGSIIYLAILLTAACVSLRTGHAAAIAPVQTKANVMVEQSFEAQKPHDDPFNTIMIDVVFTTPNNKTLRVPAFWAGSNKWSVRYASSLVGSHRFVTECSDRQDKGLHGVVGEVRIEAYTGDNPFYKHGPLCVAADKRYLQHADGTPFFWLGDTWWMGLCHRLRWPEEVKMLATDRKLKGFNVIQIVAGHYPDMPPFDPRGTNEAGFPWEEKYTRIRPEYFNAADQRLKYLVDQGFSPCIVGAWGYFMPEMGPEKVKQHWRYLIARFGALPVTWCAAGEANLPWYLVKGFPYDDRQQVTQWTEVMRYIRATDPYHRPLTIHPTGIGRLSARHATDDPVLLDFDMLQTPHAGREAVLPTVQTVQQSYAAKPTMPIINGEAAYEMLGDRLPTQWTRQMFWLCMTNGAAGHTYGANGIWQCNRPEQPYGKSPHGGDYGHIPWNQAMNLPGSKQVGLGKKLFEKYEWQKFVPHPEWARYDEATSLNPKWANWIWTPEGDPAKNAPVAKRFFRKTFELPASTRSATGTLWISADDHFTAYLNGEKLANHGGTGTYATLDISSKLKPGTNVLAIEAENLAAPVAANPAGLLANAQIQTAAGKGVVIDTDSTWRSSKDLPNDDNWTSTNFDDAMWLPARELGKYGCGPWGTFTSSTPYGPYSSGIADQVRVIYAPESRPVLLARIGSNHNYRAQAFDPTNGNLIDLPSIHLISDSNRVAIKPAGIQSDDWVILVERVD